MIHSACDFNHDGQCASGAPTVEIGLVLGSGDSGLTALIEELLKLVGQLHVREAQASLLVLKIRFLAEDFRTLKLQEAE